MPSRIMRTILTPDVEGLSQVDLVSLAKSFESNTRAAHSVDIARLFARHAVRQVRWPVFIVFVLMLRFVYFLFNFSSALFLNIVMLSKNVRCFICAIFQWFCRPKVNAFIFSRYFSVLQRLSIRCVKPREEIPTKTFQFKLFTQFKVTFTI